MQFDEHLWAQFDEYFWAQGNSRQWVKKKKKKQLDLTDPNFPFWEKLWLTLLLELSELFENVIMFLYVQMGNPSLNAELSFHIDLKL